MHRGRNESKVDCDLRGLAWQVEENQVISRLRWRGRLRPDGSRGCYGNGCGNVHRLHRDRIWSEIQKGDCTNMETLARNSYLTDKAFLKKVARRERARSLYRPEANDRSGRRGRSWGEREATGQRGDGQIRKRKSPEKQERTCTKQCRTSLKE